MRQLRPVALDDRAHLVGNSLDPLQIEGALVRPFEIGWHHDVAADASGRDAPLRHVQRYCLLLYTAARPELLNISKQAAALMSGYLPALKLGACA